MGNHTDGRWKPVESSSTRPKQLRQVAEQLTVILESVDLEREHRLADEVVEALRAIDRAYELETGSKPVGHTTSLETWSTIGPGMAIRQFDGGTQVAGPDTRHDFDAVDES